MTKVVFLRPSPDSSTALCLNGCNKHNYLQFALVINISIPSHQESIHFSYAFVHAHVDICLRQAECSQQCMSSTMIVHKYFSSLPLATEC